MKKKFYLIIVLILAILAYVSAKDDNHPPEERKYRDKVIFALDEHDADKLKSLFSKNSRDNIEDMDFKIALLLKRYKGKSTSVKYDRDFPVVTEDKEQGIKRIETYYVVETDGGCLDFMYLQVVAKDDEDPDEVGISSMMFSPEIWQITMDDSNRGYYLWVDNPFWAHYVDPDDVMTTESGR